MTTTTTLPANRYPGTCAKCGQHVEANAGVRYRLPRAAGAGWKVRCGDEQACTTRSDENTNAQQAREQARQDRERQRYLTSEKHQTALRVAERYQFPKTIKVQDGDWLVTVTRRSIKNRNKVVVKVATVNTVTGFREYDERAEFYTEADATLWTWLRLTPPYTNHNPEPYEQIIESAKVQ